MDLPRYDELHVISDLHMGGDRLDFQIVRETKRLAGLVRPRLGSRDGSNGAVPVARRHRTLQSGALPRACGPTPGAGTSGRAAGEHGVARWSVEKAV